MNAVAEFDLAPWMARHLSAVEQALSDWVCPSAPAGLGRAMRYAVLDGGKRVALDLNYLKSLMVNACAGLGKDVSPEPIVAETMRNLYDCVPMEEVYKASILASRTLIEKDPDYTYVTARLLMHTIAKEILGKEVTQDQMAEEYINYFPQFIKKGVDNDRLDAKLMQFDLKKLAQALKPERDLQFD